MKLTAKAYLRIAAKKPIKNWRDKYDYVGDFHEGLARVQSNLMWGFVDETGNEVVPPKYDGVGDFHEGLAVVRFGDTNTGKLGFINRQGEEVVEPKYDMVGNFYKGYATVEFNDQVGYIDKTGKEVIPCVYNYGDLPERKNIPSLSLQIRKKYENDPEGLEFVCPEFDWKAWYEQVTK